MADDPILYVLLGSCLVVLLILMVGIGGFAKGGEFNRKYANKLMRARVAAQLVAVLLLVGYVFLRSLGGE